MHLLKCFGQGNVDFQLLKNLKEFVKMLVFNLFVEPLGIWQWRCDALSYLLLSLSYFL